jgi:peptide deformylase
MPVRDIVQLGDPRLRTPAEQVTDSASPAVAALLVDLADTLAHWRSTTGYGRGIAAPQIGVPRRVVFLNVDRPWPLVNPSIVERSSDAIVVWDACLSFPVAFFCQVARSSRVRVRYQDTTGASHALRADGDLAERLQHELDHLDGILAVDRMLDVKTLCMCGDFERRHRADSRYALKMHREIP